MLLTSRIHGDRHILSLTGLRAVGVILVVVYHFHKMEGTVLAPLVNAAGVAGLMIFFALSGYILTYVHHTELSNGGVRPWAAFLWKRLARIYPLHFFMLFIFVIFFPAFGDPAASGQRQLFLNLTLTHGWFDDPLSFVQASWSISVEFFCYLIFPALLVMRYRRLGFVLFMILGRCFMAVFKVATSPCLSRSPV